MRSPWQPGFGSDAQAGVQHSEVSIAQGRNFGGRSRCERVGDAQRAWWATKEMVITVMVALTISRKGGEGEREMGGRRGGGGGCNVLQPSFVPPFFFPFFPFIVSGLFTVVLTAVLIGSISSTWISQAELKTS